MGLLELKMELFRYLALFGSEKHDAICNRIKYIINILFIYIYIYIYIYIHTLSHYYAKIKDISYDSMPVEKILTLYNVIILIKSVLNKDKNHYQQQIARID